MNLSSLKIFSSYSIKWAKRGVIFLKTVINHVGQPICSWILVFHTGLYPKENRVHCESEFRMIQDLLIVTREKQY